MERQWELALEALEKVLAELDGQWPVPYPTRHEHPITRRNRMKGYTRERGRRDIRVNA